MTTSDPTRFDTFTAANPFIAGEAPCVAYFDARHLSATRQDVLSWDFGDGKDLRLDPVNQQPVNANSALTSQIAAHWYLFPGRYTCSCTVTSPNGQKKVHPFTVLVAADSRRQIYFAPNGNDANDGSEARPLLSAAAFVKWAQEPDVTIHLTSGMTLKLPAPVQVTTNLAIAGNGAIIAPPANGPAFAGWPGRTSDVLIYDLTIDGAGESGTSAASIRGDRFAFVDCSLGTLGRGIVVDDTNADCVLLQGIRQLVPTGITSQCVYIGGGHRVVTLWCTLTGSTAESPLRADGTMIDGATVEYCDLSQPGYAKAALTWRCGTDVTIANNKVSRSDLSANVGDGDPVAEQTTRITNLVVRGNLLSCEATQATMRVDAGVIGVTLNANTILRNNGPAITIAPDATGRIPLSDVIISNNIVSGTAVRLVQIGAAPAGWLLPTLAANSVNGIPNHV